MRRKILVDSIRNREDFVSKYLDDLNRDDLRRLVIELEVSLYTTAGKLARESLLDKEKVLKDIYSNLAEDLTDAWTYDGEWDTEDLPENEN